MAILVEGFERLPADEGVARFLVAAQALARGLVELGRRSKVMLAGW